MKGSVKVLLPYEITLFSNAVDNGNALREVLLPYEITLFSNAVDNGNALREVLLPYEITLFSNIIRIKTLVVSSFTTL